jgi:hypothetical protein
MPLRDGTGPTGAGSRTGRGAGNCAGQGGAGRFDGRGLGMGRGGRGRGLGRGLGGLGYAPDQERSWLEQQLKSLQSALQSITERLDALKKE